MASNIPFYGRERELDGLESRYLDPSFQFLPVYGRRRVGKTSLLREFVRDKANVLFFTARQTSAAENLAAFSHAIDSQLYRDEGDARGEVERQGDREPDGELDVVRGPRFWSFEEALRTAVDRMERRSDRLGRPIVVIDEYPYLAKGDPSASSVLQILIDGSKDASDLMLVLCGSSMSFMEHQVLGHESPLYGRRTGQMKLLPMDAFESAGFLARLSDEAGPTAERAVELYGIVGGIPLYLSQFDPVLSTEANLASRVLALDAFLYGEPTSLLLQEVREPAHYNAVLTATATGRTQLGEIADLAGVNVNTTTAYLRKLTELQIVERWQPVPRKGGGRPGYHVTDNLFAFWHAITARYESVVEAGLGAEAAHAMQARILPSYMGRVFEDVCRQWLVREMATRRIDALPAQVGKWWGTDPTMRQQADVDVAVTTHDGPLFLGECKWTRGAVDVDVLRTLERRASLFGASDVELFCFSHSGFTEESEAYANERPHLRLVGLDELFADWIQ